jgi:hypothetical protein
VYRWAVGEEGGSGDGWAKGSEVVWRMGGVRGFEYVMDGGIEEMGTGVEKWRQGGR